MARSEFAYTTSLEELGNEYLEKAGGSKGARRSVKENDFDSANVYVEKASDPQISPEHGIERIEEAKIEIKQCFEERILQEMIPWLEELVRKGDFAAKMGKYDQMQSAARGDIVVLQRQSDNSKGFRFRQWRRRNTGHVVLPVELGSMPARSHQCDQSCVCAVAMINLQSCTQESQEKLRTALTNDVSLSRLLEGTSTVQRLGFLTLVSRDRAARVGEEAGAAKHEGLARMAGVIMALAQAEAGPRHG
eukprot:751572-Hanusia_phi.AAC.5